MSKKSEKSKPQNSSNSSTETFTKKVIVVFFASLLFLLITFFIVNLFHSSSWGWGYGRYYDHGYNWQKYLNGNTFEYRGKRYKFSIEDEDEQEVDPWDAN